jgi:hypothetical protein
MRCRADAPSPADPHLISQPQHNNTRTTVPLSPIKTAVLYFLRSFDLSPRYVKLNCFLTDTISWLYLAFFNGLWVVFPLWILYEAYQAMSSAMSQAEMVDLVNYLKKDD